MNNVNHVAGMLHIMTCVYFIQLLPKIVNHSNMYINATLQNTGVYRIIYLKARALVLSDLRVLLRTQGLVSWVPGLHLSHYTFVQLLMATK